MRSLPQVGKKTQEEDEDLQVGEEHENSIQAGVWLKMLQCNTNI